MKAKLNFISAPGSTYLAHPVWNPTMGSVKRFKDISTK
jgi:hypothetical protein